MGDESAAGGTTVDASRSGTTRAAAAPTAIGRRHPALSEAIAAEIKRSILSGRYLPGHRLVEDHLAEDLGVSRNPVREALRLLEADGFVQIVPRRGASVATIDETEARELFQVRGALEALAARLAADRARPPDLEAWETVIRRAEAKLAEGDVADLPALNTEFHAHLVSMAGNRHLAALVGSLRDKIQWLYARGVRDRALDSWTEHRRIFEAVARGDGEGAAHTALGHIVAADRAFAKGAANGG